MLFQKFGRVGDPGEVELSIARKHQFVQLLKLLGLLEGGLPVKGITPEISGLGERGLRRRIRLGRRRKHKVKQGTTGAVRGGWRWWELPRRDRAGWPDLPG